MKLLELTCKLITACREGPEWGAMDKEMHEEWLESVADTHEWLELMAHVDEVQAYRARKEDEHISVLGQALSRAGLGWNDKCWASLDALARKVEVPAKRYRVINVDEGGLNPMVCRAANGTIVAEITTHCEDCRCAFLELTDDASEDYQRQVDEGL